MKKSTKKKASRKKAARDLDVKPAKGGTVRGGMNKLPGGGGSGGGKKL